MDNIVMYQPVARQHNNTQKYELCFLCGLHHTSMEKAVFSMWSAHATIAEDCFLCIGSVQSGYKRGQFQNEQYSAVQFSSVQFS
jgi:hypothetical protein